MSKVYGEYSTALFEIAKENNVEKEFYESLHLISDEFTDNPEYVFILSSPDISMKKRLNMLEEVFDKYVPEYVLSFVKLICEKGRIKEFSEFVSEFDALYNAFNSVVHAYISSTVELLDDKKEELIKCLEKISGCFVIPHYEIDKSLVGGVVVRMNDTIIDGSIKNKLIQFREVMKSEYKVGRNRQRY